MEGCTLSGLNFKPSLWKKITCHRVEREDKHKWEGCGREEGSTSSFWYRLFAQRSPDKGRLYSVSRTSVWDFNNECVSREKKENKEDSRVQMFCLERHTSGGPRENVTLGGLNHSDSTHTSPSVTGSICCRLVSSLLLSPTNNKRETDRDNTTKKLCMSTSLVEEKKKDHPSARRRGNLGGGCGRLP